MKLEIKLKVLYEKFDLSKYALKNHEVEKERLKFDQFMEYENGVPTGEILSDEDIVSIVRNEDGDKENSEIETSNENEETKISYTIFTESIENVIKFNEQNKCFDEEDLNKFINLVNKLRFSQLIEKQTVLDDYIRV
ncbi:unnamed protein product [Brachionus calyciflorus]|uniref:Uncharacterized protein n=1 Tax=Brachionus calyciflorus TaxID=104777 RepID=A0A813W3L6_9BILA|nr:unnamed protein product [Brachionus calyciflorus]